MADLSTLLSLNPPRLWETSTLAADAMRPPCPEGAYRYQCTIARPGVVLYHVDSDDGSGSVLLPAATASSRIAGMVQYLPGHRLGSHVPESGNRDCELAGGKDVDESLGC